MWIDAYVIAEKIVQNAFGQFYPPDPTRLAAKGWSATGSTNKNTLQWVRDILKRDGAARAAAHRTSPMRP